MSIGRKSGVLLHVTSLPGPYGAGDFGTGARRFAEFLKEAGFSLWQLLPLTPVLPVFGHSPYSSPSAFAGNPSLVSPELLFEDGLATKAELDDCAVPSGRAADFAAASEIRARLCALAFARFKSGWYRQLTDEFEKFREEENYWLRDYALYSLLKKKNGERCWADWPAELAARDVAALARFEAECAEELSFIEFTQFIFFRQLGALSAYCAELGVELMGDAPIYVAWDGADVWAARGLFDLEPDGRPRCVAGVPPDYFSETGQRWGNPLYRWEEMRRDGFAWWRSRLRHILKYCAVARIDHFRGLSAFWEIPAECETAKEGRWRPALGGEMLEAFRREDCRGGALPVVAEDLGTAGHEGADVRLRRARRGKSIRAAQRRAAQRYIHRHARQRHRGGLVERQRDRAGAREFRALYGPRGGRRKRRGDNDAHGALISGGARRRPRAGPSRPRRGVPHEPPVGAEGQLGLAADRGRGRAAAR